MINYFSTACCLCIYAHGTYGARLKSKRPTTPPLGRASALHSSRSPSCGRSKLPEVLKKWLSRHTIASEQIAASGGQNALAFSAAPLLLPPPPAAAAAAPPPGMEHRRLFSPHRAYAACGLATGGPNARQATGQIEFVPTPTANAHTHAHAHRRGSQELIAPAPQT
jgi:hypothetical protein